MQRSSAARLILASGSPRRSELLGAAGYAFAVVRSSVREIEHAPLSLCELTLLNALRKARNVACTHPAAVVLGADTLVALEDVIIGKPRDLASARGILRRLSGCTHQVCTSCVIVARHRSVAFSVISHVHFRDLTARAIDNYFARVDPLDKAGAYGAQGESAAAIIARIHGSISNVVGLPMENLDKVLRGFGIRPSLKQPRLAPASAVSRADVRRVSAPDRGTRR